MYKLFFSTLLKTMGNDSIKSAIGIDIHTERVDATRRRWADKGLMVEQGDYPAKLW